MTQKLNLKRILLQYKQLKNNIYNPGTKFVLQDGVNLVIMKSVST